MYNNNDAAQPTTSKRNSLSSQPRLLNGQFARIHPQKREIENKAAAPSTSVPYLSHDHQYQKPMPQTYNGYSPQRPMHSHYQQSYNYQHQQNYPNNQMHQQQQGYASPNSNSYHSPQHPSMQSSHAVGNNVPPGFQSPTYNNPVGYHSPGHPMMSPQQSYAGRQDYHYPTQTDRQSIHVNQQQQQQQQHHQQQQQQQQQLQHQQQQAVFQNPPHQPQYQSPQYYQRPSPVPAQSNQSFNLQQGYHNIHQQPQHQYNNSNTYQQNNSSNQSYNAMSNQYRQQPKQMVENQQAGYGTGHPSFQIYQSPQSSQTNYRSPMAPSANIPPEPNSEMHMRPESHESASSEQNAKPNGTPKNSPANKNPSSALRNIRHDQPNVKVGQNSPDIGFSNQYLNFISNRNEPKDNANTPKFTNSPSISQKMHKNLYVSSPEQAQIPPSSGMSDSDSKDGMTAQTGTPIQSAKVSHTLDRQKDISKRQLDFEHRAEFQSEDSRDSVSKDSRISTVYSRPSDLHSDGYGMDVDSENSMECGAFKSTHSISLVETSDIPRPADIDFPKLIDPFNKKLLGSLLEYVKFPNKTHADGYVEVRSVPKLQLTTVISVGNTKFSVDKQLGKGNYGAVFLCLDLHSNKSVAVKYQKPSRPWEFYICQEIKARIKDPFMV